MAETGLTERLLRQDRRIVIVALLLLFALAGLYTVSGVGMPMTAIEMTAMRGMHDMPGPIALGAWSLRHALLVLLMWWVMMIAMMLPSVTPTVLLYSALLRGGPEPAKVPAISASFLGGYLVIWGAFSAFAMAAQWVLEGAGMLSGTMMTLMSTVPGAMILIAAGIFQFSALKRACLRQCRSPAKFLTQRRRPGVAGAFMMGLEHGTYCVGCCWFLMALLFVGGVMNLFWIVGLAVFVALEKLTPYGETASKIAGTTMIAWGVYVLVSAI